MSAFGSVKRPVRLGSIGSLILGFALSFTPFTSSVAQAPFLNSGGLPPFLASMQKHEVMVKVELAESNGQVKPAPKDLQVTFRILAQGQKVRDYHEKTDDQGRAFFLGVPSNPEVQMSISYELLVDYMGVRFPFSLKGIPTTEDQDVLLDEFDPTQRLPENHVTLTLTPPSQGLEGVSIHHGSIEFDPDEESLVVIHRMTLRNDSDKVLDMSHQPQGGLRFPAPDGAKQPELHGQHIEDLEVRGTSVYYTGALLPHSTRQIDWIYTLPYKSSTFSWSQAMPVPSTVGMIVAPRFKKPQHQRPIMLSLETIGGLGEMKAVSTGPDRIFHSIRIREPLEPNQALHFKIGGLPAPPLWKRYALLMSIVLVIFFVILIGTREGDTSDLVSRDQMMIERDRLLKALARMELALKKGRITPQRYQREKETITARLVTIYRALEIVEQEI